MTKNKGITGIICVCVLLLMTGCGAGEENGTTPEHVPESAFVDDQEQGGSVQEPSQEPAEDSVRDLSQEPAGETVGESAQDSSQEPAEDSAQESSREPSRESPQTPEQEPEVENEFYQKLIYGVRKCIAGEEVELPEEYDFSVIIHMWPDSDTLGYFIEDIDGNGTEELIFGENWGKDLSVVYNIYTISAGELVRVTDGCDRNQYYLCENGMIANEGSSSAAESCYAYFTFDGSELHFVESVIYDGYKDPENPWFYSTESAYDAEYAEPVSEERARETMGRYVYKKLTFIPFAPQD